MGRSRARSPAWPTATAGWRASPPAPCCTWGPASPTASANLHNARRAATPIVNIVGEHATYHLQYDAPLASDIAELPGWSSGWMHSSTSAGTVAADGARAVAAVAGAAGPDRHPDPARRHRLERRPRAPRRRCPGRRPPCSSEAVDRAARALRSGKRAALLIRGAALHGPGLDAAGAIAEATGCRLMCDTFAPRLARGAGRVKIERIPYFAEQIVEALSRCRDR